MQSALQQLTELVGIQNANMSITPVKCDDCNKRHTKVEITLPDGYSWESPHAGRFSGIGVTSECRQPASTLYGEMYSVIGHPVVIDND
jgi:hypothetical protein